MNKSAVTELNSLVLAFMGDGVLSAHVRKYLIQRHNAKAGKLHQLAKTFVSAKAQAAIFDRLRPMLTPEEDDVARRARNAHNKTKAKNTELSDYKKATALEAVLGYLSLLEEDKRLAEMLDKILLEGERISLENINGVRGGKDIE